MCTHILLNTIVCYLSAYITTNCLLKKKRENRWQCFSTLAIIFLGIFIFEGGSKEEVVKSVVTMSVVEWWELHLTVTTMHIHHFLICLMIRPSQFYKLYSQIYKASVHIKLRVFTWILALNKLNTHYDPRWKKRDLMGPPSWYVLFKKCKSRYNIFVSVKFTSSLYYRILKEFGFN